MGIQPFPFVPDALQRIAVRQSGLSDFGDDAQFRTGLEVLCRSIEADASLTLVGRMTIRNYVVRALVNRLRYVHARVSEPEVAAVELEPPIIVVGLPRSGTTLLHHLLALDPRARSLRFWELVEPIAGVGPDRRREQLSRTLADMKRIDTAIDGKHHFDVDNPEECMLLLDPTLVSLSFWVFAPVHTYLNWVREQDLRGSYEVYRWYLQRFARDNPGRRLVLKAPAHTAAIDALFSAIPNARVVQIHRDPAEVAPSLNSLIFSLHALVADPLDVERMAENNMSYLERIIAATKQARAAGRSWAEVQYGDLVRDPVGCVGAVYEQLGLPFDDQLRRRVEQHVAARPQHKFGKHRYSAEDFGSSQAALRERFADYHATHVKTTSHELEPEPCASTP